MTEDSNLRLSRVERATWWFNTLSRALVLLGVGSIAIGITVSVSDFGGETASSRALELWVSGLSNLLVAGLFVLVRDSFRALAEVIRDTADIV